MAFGYQDTIGAYSVHGLGVQDTIGAFLPGAVVPITDYATNRRNINDVWKTRLVLDGWTSRDVQGLLKEALVAATGKSRNLSINDLWKAYTLAYHNDIQTGLKEWLEAQALSPEQVDDLVQAMEEATITIQ